MAPTEENALRVRRAIHDFGAPAEALGIRLEDLRVDDVVVQFGLPPRRIDLMTSVSGLRSFDEAWAERVVQTVDDLPLPFIGREALARNKRASGRTKDLADLGAWERHRPA